MSTASKRNNGNNKVVEKIVVLGMVNKLLQIWQKKKAWDFF